MNIPTNYYCFMDLRQMHRWFDSEFLWIQIQLMRGEYTEAVKNLDVFLQIVNLHAGDEEELLLPLYEQNIRPVPPGGASEFFRKEHKEMLRRLIGFKETVQNWVENKKIPGENLVHLFDEMYRYKHLFEHHDARENTFLFRLLDKSTDQKTKTHVLAEMTQNQMKLMGELNGLA